MPTTFNPDKIIERLKTFNYKYKYEPKNSVITIYLSLFCYLKLDFSKGGLKMTSYNNLDVSNRTLEYGFLSTLIGLSFFAYFSNSFQHTIYLYCVVGIIISYYVICFIKTETMKVIIHNWIEKDSLN
jgi:hypothetical protein